MKTISCFKAYDVRGRVPEELNEDIARDIACAYCHFIKPKTVVVGADMRLTSQAIAGALTEGITCCGADVIDIGMCGTEEVYFAVAESGASGGIMVTASHNPKDYNGLKFVREDARPVSETTGLKQIRAIAEQGEFACGCAKGRVIKKDFKSAYIKKLLSFVDIPNLKPLKAVVNIGNGCAGWVIDALEKHLPFNFIKMFAEPDGTFPNGVPNPLLPENRACTSRVIREKKADIGIAWDGDFDRCFFFDEHGEFIEGYYIVGFLASNLLKKEPGARIVYDPRLTWNTIEMVSEAGGVPVLSRSGHAFMKEVMRDKEALYGGEMSAHQYFRDFSYCDSGMIPWLLILEIMSQTGKKLSELVGDRIKKFPASGEINNKVKDPDSVIERIERRYKKDTLLTDRTDGLSMEFERWRFNLRKSNTEPVIRLNVESRSDETLMRQKTEELLNLIES